MSIIEGIKVAEEIRAFLTELSGNAAGINFQKDAEGRLAYSVNGFSMTYDPYRRGAVFVLASTNHRLEEKLITDISMFLPLTAEIRQEISTFYEEHQRLQSAVRSRGDVN